MSRQCLQRSEVIYLTPQRFTVSTYIGGGLQSEDFQTFFYPIFEQVDPRGMPNGYPGIPQGAKWVPN